MNARLAAIAALLALATAPSRALAVTECLPRQLLGAIQHAERVRIVQLGPVEEGADDRHEDPPGRFLGCRRGESIEIGGVAAQRLVDAFRKTGDYACGSTPVAGDFGRGARGVLGVEFDGPRGCVRARVTLPEGGAEVGFASGVRFRVSLTADAQRSWWRFLEAFATERRTRPEDFLADMLEDQAGGRPAPPPVTAPTPRPAGAPPPSPATTPPPSPAATGEPKAPAATPPEASCAIDEHANARIDDLPVAVTRVAPEIPAAARTEGLDATVLVQVLVCRDGRVHDARIVSSVPMLDEAALAAVRRWTFKPARSGGKPIACWMTVPVRFRFR